MRRRGTMRSEWIAAVASSDVGNATKALLLYLASRMSANGHVEQFSRDELARLFQVHPQRIAERLAEGRAAGLIQRIDGTGTRGQPARYLGTLPSCVPESSTHDVPESSTQWVPPNSTHEPGFVTGERYVEIGTHSEGFRTAEQYSQRARVTKASRKRDDHERDAGVSPEHLVTQVGSDEQAPAQSPLAADSPEQTRTRADEPGCAECQRMSAFGTGPCPRHRVAS